MSTEPNKNPNPSGDGGKPSGDPKVKSGDDPKQSPTPVSREEFDALKANNEKLLGELTNSRTKNKDFEKADKERETKELEEQGKHKELNTVKDKEIASLKDELKVSTGTISDSKKLDAFLEKLPGTVSPGYWGLVDLEQITLNEDKTVNEESVSKLAESFTKNFSRVIETKSDGPKTPNKAPVTSGSGKLTKEEWNNLPLKDKKTRMGDVVLPT